MAGRAAQLLAVATLLLVPALASAAGAAAPPTFACTDIGPKPTPASIRNGLFSAPPVGGDPFHFLQMLGRPDVASPQGDYTGLHDEREVFWCANQVSPLNKHNGTYVPVDAGRRFQLGQWPVGDPAVFPNGPC